MFLLPHAPGRTGGIAREPRGGEAAGRGRALRGGVGSLAGLALALLGIAGCSGGGAVSPEELAAAREALAPFKAELQRALQSGLEEGPAHAIRVCRDLAPAIAESLGTDRVRLGRTSARVRNPGNAPEPWAEPFLAGYARNPGDREPKSARLDRRTVVYVEPIHVQPLCLNCHGERIPASVEAELRALYPEDTARGYVSGDFRGIFWVKLTRESGS